MRLSKLVVLCLFFSVAAFAQTVDLGQDVFFNDEGTIVIAADASVAVRKLDSPYLMFMLYMGAKGDHDITISRDTVVMIYNDQEYKMPTFKELRDKYQGENNDTSLYRRMGKESLVLSQMRNWKYQRGTDFFPPPGSSLTAVDQASIASNIGFATRVYFKNLSFKKGDKIIIKVWDKNNPDLMGAVAVIL
jgi:hypothetical protein